VQVASIQTLLSRGQLPPADLIIADESHHLVAEQWNTIPKAYPKAFILGLTATPERADGTALGNLFEALYTVAQPRELISLGNLVPVQVWAPPSIPNGALGAPVVDAWLSHAKGLRTIVFATHVNHAAELAKRFCDAGVPSECVDGEMDHDVRRSAIRRFEKGETRVLTNVYVLTEGFDVPGVECVVLARGFSACSTYIQAVGRAMRPAPGKTAAIVLDLKGAVHEHGMPDDDRQYSLDGDPIKRVDKSDPIRQCKRCGAVFAASVRECPRCGATLPKLPSPEERQAKLEAIRRVATMDDKRIYLEKMQRVAHMKGYNAGWSAHMFKAKYGHFPDRRLWA
jgi:superfamily II DNA or RNA helicase